MEHYHRMKKDQLMALAREAGVRGRSRMTRGQLAEALSRLAEAVEPAGGRVPASVPPAQPEAGARPHTPLMIPELPVFLGENRLVLMPQAPRTAFAYWELAEGLIRENLVLDVIEAGTGGKVVRLDVGGRTGSRYVHLERSGMEIEAFLSAPDGDGFFRLLRSNTIRLPDDSPSLDLPNLWMTRRKDFEEIFHLSSGDDGIGDMIGIYAEQRQGYTVGSKPGKGKKGDS